MSADSRIWGGPEWTRYETREKDRINTTYLDGDMTTALLYDEHDRIHEEFVVYVRARMQLWKRKYISVLEF